MSVYWVESKRNRLEMSKRAAISPAELKKSKTEEKLILIIPPGPNYLNKYTRILVNKEAANTVYHKVGDTVRIDK